MPRGFRELAGRELCFISPPSPPRAHGSSPPLAFDVVFHVLLLLTQHLVLRDGWGAAREGEVAASGEGGLPGNLVTAREPEAP